MPRASSTKISGSVAARSAPGGCAGRTSTRSVRRGGWSCSAPGDGATCSTASTASTKSSAWLARDLASGPARLEGDLLGDALGHLVLVGDVVEEQAGGEVLARGDRAHLLQ